MTYYLRPYQTRKETVFDELFNDFFNVGIHGGALFSQPDSIKSTRQFIAFTLFNDFQKDRQVSKTVASNLEGVKLIRYLTGPN